MKKYIQTLVFALVFMVPSYASAAPLTSMQVDSILTLLAAFGVDETTIESVRLALVPTPVTPTENDPAPVTTPPPAVVPVPSEPSVPTRLALTVWPKTAWVVGANCDPVYITPTVYDQYGKEMSGEKIDFISPIWNTSLKSGMKVTYNAQSTNTDELLRFSSGSLSAEWALHTGDGLNSAKLLYDGSAWYEASGGARVDKEKLLCR